MGLTDCLHENIDPDHWEPVTCPTPYCTGSESMCSDCGAFLRKCSCGYMNEVVSR